MSYKQETEYGRVWKYDTFTFNVPEFKELLKEGRGYLVTNWGGKQWLALPHEDGEFNKEGMGSFTIVIKSQMTYMDKLKKANARKQEAK
jgi:hypothetical protein